MKIFMRILLLAFYIVSISTLDARKHHEEEPTRALRKQRREQWEKINHQHAFNYALKLVDKTRKDITLKDILTMHYFILRNIDDTQAGRLRRVNVRLLSQQWVKFPHYKQVPEAMNNFIKWLHAVEGDPILIAVRAFCKFVLEIHPFADGNGRTSRLLMNVLLMQAGYRPLHFHKQLNPDEYYDVYIPALNRVLFYGDFREFDALIKSRLKKRTPDITDEELALNYEQL
jgi:Fic family protein